MITEDILQQEVDYSFECIDKVKKNESAWNYLRGMTNKYPSVKEAVLDRYVRLCCSHFSLKDASRFLWYNNVFNVHLRCSKLIEQDAYHNNYLAVGLVADLRYALSHTLIYT